jgi:hypothetical protein
MNVWYELGLAHALSKKVVLLRRTTTSKPQPLPFDVAHQRVLMYDPEKENLQGLLDRWLAEAEGVGCETRVSNKPCSRRRDRLGDLGAAERWRWAPRR